MTPPLFFNILLRVLIIEDKMSVDEYAVHSTRPPMEIYVALRGKAGAGKTYYLKKIAKLLGDDGFDLHFNYGTGIEFLKAVCEEE